MSTELDSALRAAREAFATATFLDGGLLLHLPSGDFFSLDREGAAVWDAIGRLDDLAATLSTVSASLQLPPAESRRLVERILDQAKAVGGQPAQPGPHFHEDEQAVVLRVGDQRLLSLDKDSLVLTVAEQLDGAPDEQLAELLRVFVPKLFGRWFPLALHASAIDVAGRTVLFCGDSGAGKTTTARVLAEQVPHSRLISEDVVLLAEVDGQLEIVEQAETAIQSWMSDAMVALVEERRRSCEASPLQRALAAKSSRRALHKIIFLDARNRGGDQWSLAVLPPAAALTRLFVHSFFHSSDASALRGQLRACRTLATQITAADASAIPAGLDTLRTGSRAQIDTIAS